MPPLASHSSARRARERRAVKTHLEPFGDTAFRVRLPGRVNAPALQGALRSHPRVVDAVVTEGHALVVFDPASPPDGLDDALARAMAGADPGDCLALRELPACKDVLAGVSGAPGRAHVIRVRYDGEDLSEVAHTVGATREDVIAMHAAALYVVRAVGFLPGFAYLRGLDPRLTVPRRKTPRPRVPPQSVAVAGPYTGVYPYASPGGWNLIGTAVDFMPFDVDAGALLALGDSVTFAPVSA
jgi:UPF0271 protein